MKSMVMMLFGAAKFNLISKIFGLFNKGLTQKLLYEIELKEMSLPRGYKT